MVPIPNYCEISKSAMVHTRAPLKLDFSCKRFTGITFTTRIYTTQWCVACMHWIVDGVR